MIVVIGSPRARMSAMGTVHAVDDGSTIAAASAAAGAAVQIVGRVGEDAAGDGVLLDLARHGVAHVAVLRDAVAPTLAASLSSDDDGLDAEPRAAFLEPSRLDAADLQLALSYLPEYRVIVVAEPLDVAAMRVVIDAGAWSGAALIVIGQPADGVTLPDDTTVFEPPGDGDPEGAFAAMVGAYAAGLDRGEDPRTAFEAASASVGSTAAAE